MWRVNKTGEFFEAWYPFIRGDVFLIAQVNKISGRQKLIMHKIDPITGKILLKSAIDCIHTAVGDIPLGEFEATVMHPEFEKDVLRIRSSERLKEINLDPEEKFKAFQSWVAGIAEAGMAAFAIQGEIDKAANLQYPIALPLLRFMALADPSFLPSYFDYLNQSCYHEGERYGTFLMANLLPVIEFLLKEPKGLDVENMFEAVLSIDPPLSLFIKNEEIFRLFAKDKPGFLPYYLERIQSESKEMSPTQAESALGPALKIIIEGKTPHAELPKVVDVLLSMEVTIKFLAKNPALFTNLASNCKGFLHTYLECICSGVLDLVPGGAEGSSLASAIQPVLEMIAPGSRDDVLEVMMSLRLPLETFTSEPRTFRDLVLHYPNFLSYYLGRIREEWKGPRAGDGKWLRSVIKHTRTVLDLRQKKDVAEFFFQLDLPPAFFTVGLEMRSPATNDTPQPARLVVISPMRGHFDVPDISAISQLFRNVIVSRGDVLYLRFLGFRVDFSINIVTPKSRVALITASTRVKVRTMDSEEYSEVLAKCSKDAILVLFGIAEELRKKTRPFLSLKKVYGSYVHICEQYALKVVDAQTFRKVIRALSRVNFLYPSRHGIAVLNITVEELHSLLSTWLILGRGGTHALVPKNLLKLDQKRWTPPKDIFKILLMGEGGIGALTFALKYVNGTFIADTSMTIAPAVLFKDIKVNGKVYHLHLWRPGAQDRFRFLAPSYTAGAKGAILFYDTTRMSTLDSLEEWVGICRTYDKNLPILFCGTKTDLVEERSVANDYAKGFLEPLGMFDYLEISSKTGENVEKAIELLVKKIIEQ